MTLYPNTNIFTKIAFENKVSFKFLLHMRRKKKVQRASVCFWWSGSMPPSGMILCFAFLNCSLQKDDGSEKTIMKLKQNGTNTIEKTAKNMWYFCMFSKELWIFLGVFPCFHKRKCLNRNMELHNLPTLRSHKRSWSD